MNRLVVFVVVLGALMSCVHNAPVGRQQGKNKNSEKKAEKAQIKAAKFLVKFGYFDDLKGNSAGAKDPSSPAFRNAIKRLQKFGNIPVTGVIDRETLELMSKSRCGVKDPSLPGSRKRRYTLQGTEWEKLDLTYKIINFTDDGIPHEKQRQIIRQSFDLWQKATRLRITEVTSGNADILISYVTGDHGDGYPFDGQGGTLAHAFYPHHNQGLSGDAHFDDDERFTTGTSDGINLDWVAVHEFGHSLGLEHSGVEESIMYPWYKGYFPNIKLDNDDEQGIQAIYGAPLTSSTVSPTTTEVPTTTDIPTTTGQPSTTQSPATTEIPPTTGTPTTTWAPTTTGAPTTTRKPTTAGTPSTTEKPTTTRAPFTTVSPTTTDAPSTTEKPATTEAPSTTEYPTTTESPTTTVKPTTANPTDHPACKPGTRYDAVFVDANGSTYFFKGDQYWTVSVVNSALEKSEPQQVRDTWPDVSTPVEAAYLNSKGRIIFFKGKNFWEYNGTSLLKSGSIQREYGFSRSLRSFSARLNAVFTLQGEQMTYFIKGPRYVRYNEAMENRASSRPEKIRGAVRGAWKDVINMDAATTWINDKVYVFKGEDYFRLSIKNGKFSVDKGYPQRIAKKWMRCPNQPNDSMSTGSLDSEL